MNRGGIQTESVATRSGIVADASCARAPASVNPTRPAKNVVLGEGSLSSSLPSLPIDHEDVLASKERLADLEAATVADAELIHDCRWMAAAARRRIANRRDEIERLRTVVLAGMEAA